MRNQEDKALTAVCPECKKGIQFPAAPRPYHLFLCPHCETMLLVTAVSPLQIDWAFEEPGKPIPHRGDWRLEIRNWGNLQSPIS